MKLVRAIMVFISIVLVAFLFAQPILSTTCSEDHCIAEVSHDHDQDQDKDAHHSCDCSCHAALSIGVVFSELEIFSDSSVKFSVSLPKDSVGDDLARRLYQPPRLS
jgi:hypothetical protein